MVLQTSWASEDNYLYCKIVIYDCFYQSLHEIIVSPPERVALCDLHPTKVWSGYSPPKYNGEGVAIGFQNMAATKSNRFLLVFADKCLAPYYGSCSTTRMCINSRNGVNCGDCFPGLVDVAGQASCGSKLIITDTASILYTNGQSRPQVDLVGTVRRSLIGRYPCQKPWTVYRQQLASCAWFSEKVYVHTNFNLNLSYTKPQKCDYFCVLISMWPLSPFTWCPRGWLKIGGLGLFGVKIWG